MRRLIIAIAPLALASCISLYGDLSDLEAEVAVHESKVPDGMTSNQYAIAFGFGGTLGTGVDFVAVGNSPGGVGLLRFDASGGLSSNGQPTPADVTLDTRPPVANLPDESTILIGMRRGDGTGFVGIYSPAGLSDTLNGVTVPAPPLGIAAGAAIFDTTGPDLVAVDGVNFNLVSEFSGAPVAGSCGYPGARNVVAANFDPGTTEFEVAVIDSTALAILASPIPDGGGSCAPAPGLTIDGAGGDGFADNIAVGDFDGNGQPDVAISHHTQNRVYVVYNPSSASPGALETINGPAGSSFGTSIAAGDIDDSGGDELIVGASSATAKDVSQAGLVQIFAHNGTAMEVAGVLSRAKPESGDLYGRAVGVATFAGGRSIVLVGGNAKVFVNFRDPLGAPDPRDGQ